MFSSFPLFQSHLDLAHRYWAQLIQPNDWIIDATCGNGNDTLHLAEIALKTSDTSGIIAIDIQEEAVARTKERIETRLNQEKNRVHYYQQSHSQFPDLAFEKPIRLVVYNLGYLPGADKTLTTLTSSSLESIRVAKDLILPGGALSITCYPGHTEGAREERALLEEVSRFSAKEWNVCHHRFLNRTASPSLLLIQKASQ